MFCHLKVWTSWSLAILCNPHKLMIYHYIFQSCNQLFHLLNKQKRQWWEKIFGTTPCVQITLCWPNNWSKQKMCNILMCSRIYVIFLQKLLLPITSMFSLTIENQPFWASIGYNYVHCTLQWSKICDKPLHDSIHLE
jgi:hypothetical protein